MMKKKLFKSIKIWLKDLSENPEFLHDYAYILREFGYRDQARATAEKYLALVPDDVNMQTFFEDY